MGHFFCVCLALFWFFLFKGEGGGMAVLKNSLDKMIKLLLPKIQIGPTTFFCVCLPLFWFFLYIIFFYDRCDEGRGGAVLKSSLDKMIQLLLLKIQFTEKTNLHIYLASNFTNVHNNIQLVLWRLYRQVVLQFLYPPWSEVLGEPFTANWTS